MSKQPLLVGITGGIGAGKSMVCKVFQHLSIPIYEADTRARMLMVENAGLINQIKSAFGNESYTADGGLDKSYLADRVFNNTEELQKLNGLVHPKVGEDFANWVSEHLASPYLIKEAALLIESGSYKSLDKLIVVTATKETRTKRVLLRDHHRSKEEVAAIMDKQLSDSAFKKHADYVISNNEEELLLPHILRLHKELSELAGQRG